MCAGQRGAGHEGQAWAWGQPGLALNTAGNGQNPCQDQDGDRQQDAGTQGDELWAGGRAWAITGGQQWGSPCHGGGAGLEGDCGGALVAGGLGAVLMCPFLPAPPALAQSPVPSP